MFFQNFPISFRIFHICTLCTVCNNSLLTPFLLFSRFHAHPTNTTSQNIGGRMHGPSPTSNFGGTVLPVLPRSPPMIVAYWCSKLTTSSIEHQCVVVKSYY